MSREIVVIIAVKVTPTRDHIFKLQWGLDRTWVGKGKLCDGYPIVEATLSNAHFPKAEVSHGFNVALGGSGWGRQPIGLLRMHLPFRPPIE